jgi:gluconokinase
MVWLVVVMGVAGSGKTTVGRALAMALQVPFCDADDLHPPANTARMQQGLPLDDAHRWPWLAAVHDRLATAAQRGEGLVMACSALKASYRQRLAADLPALAFVHLQAPRAVLENRLANRRGHFFPATLLDSQLATLEPLSAAEGFAVDATLEVEPLVAAIRLGLHNRAR